MIYSKSMNQIKTQNRCPQMEKGVSLLIALASTMGPLSLVRSPQAGTDKRTRFPALQEAKRKWSSGWQLHIVEGVA